MAKTNDETLRIDLATEAEAEEVSSILLEAANWLTEQGKPMWKPAELTPDKVIDRINIGEFYLAKIDSIPVGTIIYQLEDLFFWPDVPVGESAFIHRLAVKRSAAGVGVAPAMVRWAREKAKSQGKKYLRLDCDGNRPRLCAYYESLDFRLHSHRPMGKFFMARYEMTLIEDN